MNYYQHHIGDYRADTAHLSLLEHGAYRQLIDWYYLNEAPIPKETQLVFRRLSARTECEQNAILAVLADFFTESDSGFFHKRCDAEIDKYQAKAETNRENGAKGGRPRKKQPEKTQINPDGFEKKANVTLTNNQEPRTNNQEPITKNQEPRTNNQEVKPKPKPKKPTSAKASSDSLFKKFWAEYPKKVGIGAAEKAFEKIKPDDDMLNEMICSIKKQKASADWIKDSGQFIPHPTTWLNQRRWEDQVFVENKYAAAGLGAAGQKTALAAENWILESENG